MLKGIHQRKLPHLLSATALAAGAALLPATASADVLFLSTTETDANYENHITGAYSAFAAALGSELIDARGALTSNAINGTTLGATHLTNVDTVVVATVGGVIDATALAFVQNIITSDPNRAVILLVDSCCNRDNIFTPLVTTLQASLPGLGDPAGTDVGAWHYNPRNDSSPYATASFSALPEIRGSWYRQITNVPTSYALYVDEGRTTTGTPVTPTTPTVSNAYALLVPQKASNGGAGACTFMTSDATPFFPNSSFIPTGQPQALAQSLLHAARDAAGACKMNTAEPDLSAALTGPRSVAPGTPAEYTLTVTNSGFSPATDGTVTVTLPAGLTLDGAASAGCSFAAPVLTCTPATATDPLAGDGGAITFTFNLVASTAAPSLALEIAVDGVTGEANTSNNTATFTIGQGTAQPVPVMGWPALLGLSALLPWLTMRRRQRRAG